MKSVTTITFASPSHEQLLDDWFLPSFRWYHPDAEVLVHRMPQYCANGTYGNEGWDRAMQTKVDVVRELAGLCKTEFVLVADADIQFFGNVESTLFSALGDRDVVFQYDGAGAVNSGFYFFRVSERFVEFLAEVRRKLTLHDQPAFNEVLTRTSLRHARLGREFWNLGQAGPKAWREWDYALPDKLLMHHANYTQGVERKIRLLRHVWERRRQQLGPGADLWPAPDVRPGTGP